ncbi:MAG: helix-turn-helix domain-containing protein [Cyanobacteria bacterium SBLK]|nr:helix-turn-helix domain-containing protein [Cyanobacteria bacterium SBLK]
MPIIVVLSISRRNCNLTQEQVARLSDRSQQLIGKLEQGKAKGIGFETLSQLCKVTEGELGNVIAYISDDPRELDDNLTKLSKKLGCSTEEIWPHIPEEIRRAYRSWRSF